MDYVSLHNHTYNSLGDALSSPKDLLARAKELGQSAIAITDHATLSGAWDGLQESKKLGIKLIIGAEFNFIDDLSSAEKQRIRHVILLAKNHTGYKNLLKLNRLGNDHNLIAFKKVYPRIDWKLLEEYSDGLICLTACSGGILGQLINTKRKAEAYEQAKRLKGIFGEDLGFEIQPHALKSQSNSYRDYIDQAFTNSTLIKWGKELDVKVVATTNSHYIRKDQQEIHDVWLAIASGQPVKSGQRLTYMGQDFSVKSRDEVEGFFKRTYGNEAAEWCDNSLYFANKCEDPIWIDPQFDNPGGKELPVFDVKATKDYPEYLKWVEETGWKDAEDVGYVRWACETRLATLNIPEDKLPVYKARLEKEIDVFTFKDVNSYMAIVADYIGFCRDTNIPIGPGRGSAGGSLIAYLLQIHCADPIKYGLIFERFYNKQKQNSSDIDADFSQKYKKEVEHYISRKYGELHVAGISNILTLTPKPYVKAISRTFQYGGDFKSAVQVGNNIASILPDSIYEKDINRIIETIPLFTEYFKKYPELLKYKDLGSLPIAAGRHAAGLVISTRELAEIIPMRVDKEGGVIIEYEKERAEENGLIKMDILGLQTLDIIEETYKFIEKSNKPIPPRNFPYDDYDEAAYKLIENGNTFCVFQLGTSGGTIDLCRKIKPKCMEDLALITTLARPAAADIREAFIETRNGHKKFALLHPSLENAFKMSLGFGLYDESILQLGQDVAGWDLNDADRIRKMIKEKGKHPEKDAALRLEFIEAAAKHQNIPIEFARRIWDEEIKKFGGYSFNKSHAVLYSFISLHTAYLKAHYPIEFLTANLIAEVNSAAKKAPANVRKIKSELSLLNIKTVPPSLNRSENTYTIVDANTILTGLDAVKFIGKDAIPEILAKRPFTSFEDFLTRVDSKKVRGPSIQALAASGCMDEFGISRKKMFHYGADYKKKLQLWTKRNPDNISGFVYPFPDDIGEWTIPEKHAIETYYLGEGLSGTPQEVYPKFFNDQPINFQDLIRDFPECKKGTKIPGFYGTFQCIVEDYFESKVKKQDSKIYNQLMGHMTLRDPFGTTLHGSIFPDGLEKLKSRIKQLGKKFKIEPGCVISFTGTISWYDGAISICMDTLRRCEPPPQKPENMKPAKVSMKISGPKRASSKNKVIDLIDDFDEQLANIGMDEAEEEVNLPADYYDIVELQLEEDQLNEEEDEHVMHAMRS